MSGHLLSLLDAPHSSEKVSLLRRGRSVLVLRVRRSASKSDIKTLVEDLFGTTVERVNTLTVRGKSRRRGRSESRRRDWKKAYLFLGGEVGTLLGEESS